VKEVDFSYINRGNDSHPFLRFSKRRINGGGDEISADLILWKV
jgi:hypothetical protein